MREASAGDLPLATSSGQRKASNLHYDRNHDTDCGTRSPTGSPEDAALVKQTIERASQDGKNFEHEYRWLCRMVRSNMSMLWLMALSGDSAASSSWER